MNDPFVTKDEVEAIIYAIAYRRPCVPVDPEEVAKVVNDLRMARLTVASFGLVFKGSLYCRWDATEGATSFGQIKPPRG